MVYMGSKRKLIKHIKPIIENVIVREKIKNYFEPFVGGCNIIDSIRCKNKFGNDINKYLIELLKKQQTGFRFPTNISEDEYNKVNKNRDSYDDWYVGFVGFCSTFMAGFFNGYGVTNNKPICSFSIKSLQKQNLKNIILSNGNYYDVEIPDKSFIYCDPPYRNTTNYNDCIDYDYFYNWCIEKSKNNFILISEYNMPSDLFESILEIEHSINCSSQRINKTISYEKLFKVKEDCKNYKIHNLFSV